MDRGRISRNGIELAMPGYGVDTAPLEKMVISPRFSTMRIAIMDYVTVTPYASGTGYQTHDRAEIVFPQPFPQVPMVLVSGVFSETESDQSPFVFAIQDGSNRVWIDPHYSVVTTVSGFSLHVIKSELTVAYAVVPRLWKYFVFANRGG